MEGPGCDLGKPRPAPVGRPGRELEKLIPKAFKKPGCNCFEYARKMDRWGIIGCEQRFDEIVDHLVKQAKKDRILKAFGPVHRPVAQRWVRQAIDNAKAKQSQPVAIDNGRWFVAVTTAPRKKCTLRQCIDSLRAAGWEPTIFAEPGSTPTTAKTIVNPSRKGVWHNWLASAQHALDTDAELILTVQDDSIFHPDSRSFAESILWPADDCGFVSLYTPKHYTIRNDGSVRPVGVNRIHTGSLWGACALVWPRDVLAEVINHKRAKNWIGVRPASGDRSVLDTRRANPDRIANSDTAIGVILNSMKRTMWFVDPSPVTHAAKHSTINHGGNGGRRNCYRCADRNRPLADQLERPVITYELKT